MTDHVATETPPDAGLRAQGWTAVIVLTALIVGICVLMAFSTSNTPHSVDGDRAEYSRYIQSGE